MTITPPTTDPTAVAVEPYLSTDFSIIIEGVEYAEAASSAKLTPSASVATWKGGRKTSVFSRSTSPTYSFDLNIAQDWSTAESLSIFCQEHGGEEVEVVFVPNFHADTAKHRVATFRAIVPFVDAGGDIDAFATAAASWSVLGAPDWSTGGVAAGA